MTDRTLKSKVRQLQELQAEIDTLTAQAESLKDQIEEEMNSRAVDELEAGNAVVRWKPVCSPGSIPKASRPRTAACMSSLRSRPKPGGLPLLRKRKAPYTTALESKV